MWRILLAISLALLSTQAQADRPLATENAGLIGRGAIESESYFYELREQGVEGVQGFNTNFSVGIGFRTQLGIGLDRSRQYSEDYLAKKSSGAMVVGGKTSIKPLTADDYGIALAYSTDRTRGPGESYRYDNSAVYGVATVPVGSWLFHTNLGWKRSRLERAAATTWAVAAEGLGVAGPIDFAAETFGNDHDPAWVQVSLRWNVVAEHVFIDMSYAEQLKKQGPRLTTLGLKFAF